MEIEKYFQSKSFKIIIIVLAGLAVISFIFCLGVFVGSQRAEFSFRWADEYHRNFGGPNGGLFGDFMGMDRQFANANGSFGQIIKIDPTAGSGQVTLTVKDHDNVEKIILTDSTTVIVYQRKNIKLSDLKIDENIVVIGEPNNAGQIQAKLIRVMPPLTPQAPSAQQNPAPNIGGQP
jgi:hypothetical protein